MACTCINLDVFLDAVISGEIMKATVSKLAEQQNGYQQFGENPRMLAVVEVASLKEMHLIDALDGIKDDICGKTQTWMPLT